MNTSLVLTLVGADRPGLVESVAQLVAVHGGNWLESRMARLGGQFAGIARVTIPTAREAQVRAALAALAAQGLSVAVAQDPAQSPPAKSGRAVRLELVGQDRPGIVHQVTRVLAAHRVNVEELTTECVEAPMAGGVLFQAQAELLVPPGADMAPIRADLEKIAADLMVDLRFAEET
ncbi:MAG TPA: ACT domain-containing protein [Opitutaceae bacterium]|nr:ACT domain-containing protein [Opitutaceae bacterium]